MRKTETEAKANAVGVGVKRTEAGANAVTTGKKPRPLANAIFGGKELWPRPCSIWM
jgi:hypothetical protein